MGLFFFLSWGSESLNGFLMFLKRSGKTPVFDLSGCHNWWAPPCAGIAAMSQNAPDNELLDVVAVPQIPDACLSLCSA